MKDQHFARIFLPLSLNIVNLVAMPLLYTGFIAAYVIVPAYVSTMIEGELIVKKSVSVVYMTC